MLALAQAHVKHWVEQVHNQVDKDKDGGGQHHNGQQHRGIAVSHRIYGQRTDAVAGEDRLRHHGTADELTKGKAGHGQRRQQRIAQDVAPQQPGTASTLGTHNLHEGHIHDLIDGAQQHLRQRCGHEDGQGNYRQDEALGIACADDRHPAQAKGENLDQNDADPEGGQGNHHGRQAAEKAAQPRKWAKGGDNSHQEGQDHAYKEGEDRQRQRGGKGICQHLRYGGTGGDGKAKITGEESAERAEVAA